ncbi:STAS-like domain-containing protein [Kamptonema sp. UHCC 0994]|uniref:STAS-like domain-containing protein n=1 Tax=Kamptonema sp. UHCC 0994 TaxID=3031329 RepID=UPI0023B8EF70|nr:STAS-like domain-containing protein [Kamptonema sp. UHCC 0994]MDF0552380.1 STAS-like domain-containing protein [Kamptonema sp. UHCC 0994]
MNFLTTLTTNNTDTVTLSVTEIINDTLCITCEAGQQVFEAIAAAFRENKSVVLSFKDCEDFTRGFLSEGIAQLYEYFPEEQIRNSLSIVDIDPEDAEYIENVIYWRRRYLENPERFKEAAKESLCAEDNDE